MPTGSPIIVLDPGHGGVVPSGASSPDRSTAGLSEKALTLELARRVRQRLAPTVTVMLTRDSDTNISLDSRAGFARLVGADCFVSLHFNASGDAATDSTEAYVGRASSEGDRGLALALHQSVSAALGTSTGGVLAADLGAIARTRHLERTSAALLEVCDLSNPRRAAELRDPATLDRVAEAIASALMARLAGEPRVQTAVPAAASGVRRSSFARAQDDPGLTAALTDSEWEQVLSWQADGSVFVDPLTGDAAANALLVAGSLFCGRHLLSPDALSGDPLLCIDRAATESDPRVQQLAQQVVARGPIVNWSATTRTQRQRYAVGRLVTAYGYPVNGAAGIVGNLTAESEVLPPRLEGSTSAAPLDAPDFAGTLRHWTPQQVMDRSYSATAGPRSPGVGLAQWTSAGRRSGLFAHAYGTAPAGPRILFDMDAQLDYLVAELRGGYAGVEAVLVDPAVSLDAASDEVVYTFEVPGSVLSGGAKLPRTDAAVQAVFVARRTQSAAALTAYSSAP